MGNGDGRTSLRRQNEDPKGEVQSGRNERSILEASIRLGIRSRPLERRGGGVGGRGKRSLHPLQIMTKRRKMSPGLKIKLLSVISEEKGISKMKGTSSAEKSKLPEGREAGGVYLRKEAGGRCYPIEANAGGSRRRIWGVTPGRCCG